MSLRTKIALTVFLVAASFVTLDQWLQDVRFRERFSVIDRQRTRAAVQRVRTSFDETLETLQESATESSERVRATGSTTRRGAEDPLVARLSRDADLDLLLGLDALGGVVALRLCDSRGEPIDLPELPNEQLSVQHELLKSWCGPTVAVLEDGVAKEFENLPPRGIWNTDLGPLVVAGVESRDATGELQRWIAGRWLDEALLDELQVRSDDPIDLHTLAPGTVTAREQGVLDSLANGAGPLIEVEESDGPRVWGSLEDVHGRPAVLVESFSTGDLEGLWAEFSRDSFLSAAGMVILFPLAILVLLQIIVTGPLLHLSRRVVRIGHEDDVEARLDLERGDEIGQLADEFDGLLTKLAASRAKLVETARLAGMSEIASGTLHNVGNVLNSVNVAAKLCRGAFQSLDHGALRRVLEALLDHRGRLDEYLENDPRGSKLLPALETLLVRMERSCGNGEKESIALEEGIDRIAGLIHSLESADSRVHLSERFRLDAAIEETLGLCLHSVELPELSVVRELAVGERVQLDQHRLRDVLTQLLLNSFHSLREAASETPELRVTSGFDPQGGIRIEIADNGVGIAPEDRDSIFRLGVTTKPGGKGLGLHLAATTATELGGRVVCESEGLGQGARFVLTLPAGVLVQRAA